MPNSELKERIKKQIIEKKHAESLAEVEGNTRLLVELPVSVKAKYDELGDYYAGIAKHPYKRDMLIDLIEREHKKVFKADNN